MKIRVVKGGCGSLEEKKKKKKKKKSSGKKDACYHKVKARYDVWPSAYASGALVKCRKVGASNWGNKSKKNESLEELEAALLEAVEQELEERCQKGYKTHKKRKTKKMFGRTYRNCVKAEESMDPEALGEIDYIVEEILSEEGLRDWFDDADGDGQKGWEQIGGKYDGKPCAKQPGQKTKPKCASPEKAASMSKKEKESAARRKRKEDPNPNRKGKAKNVSTKPKRKKS